MAEQVEKSFQKQPLFQNSKVATTSRKVAGKDRRWTKEVGLGFKVRSHLSASLGALSRLTRVLSPTDPP